MEFDETRLRVIHALRLRSLAEAAELSRFTGLTLDLVQSHLGVVETEGLAIHRTGRLPGWALTAAGRVEGERLLGLQLESSGGRSVIEALYDEFLDLNPLLLAICTDWQTVRVDGIEVVNDHLDVQRDSEVLGRLNDLHGRSISLTHRMSRVLVRFSGYVPRLSLAHERILTGETEWLTRSTIDSYHTVWFELHEDLLATLGRRRVDESARRGDAPEQE